MKVNVIHMKVKILWGSRTYEGQCHSYEGLDPMMVKVIASHGK